MRTFSRNIIQRVSRPKRRSSRRRGTTLIELALVAPIFVSLCLGTWEFAFFYSIKNQIQCAAREGARAGVPWNSKISDVTSATQTALSGCGQNTANYTITVQDSSGTTVPDMTSITSGSNFTVTVRSTWGAVGSGFRPLGLIATSRVISTSCMMKREY